MKALRVSAFGDPDVLEWQDVEEPAPGPGQVLVRVSAYAVNWADLLQRAGRYPGGPRPPFTTGHDFAGVVVGRGPGTGGPAEGTRVFGLFGTNGAAADCVVGDAQWVFPIPEWLGDEEAAGLAAPFFTADAALVTMGRLVPGEHVLVQAAAGGTGTAVVQLARLYGASTVIATAGSDEKLEQVRELGADVVVNYREQDFVVASLEATDGRGVALVIESVGGDVLGRSFDCLAPTGRLVSIGASAGCSSKRFRLHTLFETGVSVAGFTLGTWILQRPDLVRPSVERVMEAVKRREIRPVVGGVFAADAAAEAHRFLEERRSVGRTIVRL